MMSERLRNGINGILGRLERGCTEGEVIHTLGLVLTEDHHDDILTEFPTERRAILIAGFNAALIRVANDDRLEAPPSALCGYPIAAIHELGLAKHLLGALRERRPRPVLSAICDPSFGLPWAVRIEKATLDPQAGEYQLIHTTIRKGQCDFHGEPPEVIHCELPISDELTLRLQAAWDRMLSNVRPSSPGGRADGVTFRFANRIHAGSAWSPRPDALPGRLASIAESLAEFATVEPEQRPAILTGLNSRLAAFGV